MSVREGGTQSLIYMLIPTLRTHSAFLMDTFLRRFFKTRATTITKAIATMRTMTTAATVPPMMATLSEELCELVEDVVSHSPSLRDEIATEHSESTVISTPFTMILAPPLTQSSIREMREPLSLSEVPSSLARYVTYVGDSG